MDDQTINLAIGAILLISALVVAWRSHREKPAGGPQMRTHRIGDDYRDELLREKLQDEGMLHGSWPPAARSAWPEGWCEHCSVWGKCSVCGSEHKKPERI